nr:unnamed protein product [Callosobruchus analis]
MVLFEKIEKGIRSNILKMEVADLSDKKIQDKVCNGMDKRNYVEYNGVNETELLYLNSLMDSPLLNTVLTVEDTVKEPPPSPTPVSSDNKDLLREVQIRCNRAYSRDARQLADIINSVHFVSLLNTHDQ